MTQMTVFMLLLGGSVVPQRNVGTPQTKDIASPRLMESKFSSPSVYSQSSYPASSSLRTPSPLELSPTHDLHADPLTCLDIYHEWFSQDMTKHTHDHTHRRHLLDILAAGRRRRERSPHSLPETDGSDPLTCVDIYREWFAADMSKDAPAHRRRLLDILTTTRRPGHACPAPPHPLPDSDSGHTSGTGSESSIHAPVPVIGWSPVSYWDDDALVRWTQTAAIAPTDVGRCRHGPGWDLWDRLQTHSREMICMHPRLHDRREKVEREDRRIAEIRRKRRVLLLEELLVRCEGMKTSGGQCRPSSHSG